MNVVDVQGLKFASLVNKANKVYVVYIYTVNPLAVAGAAVETTVKSIWCLSSQVSDSCRKFKGVIKLIWRII